MAAQKLTPEEKLFAIIQGAQLPAAHARAQALSLSGLASRCALFFSTLTLPKINRGLTVVIGVLVVWCALTPLLMRPRVGWLMEQAQRQARPFAIPPPFEGLRSSTAYLDLMRAQDPFRVEPPPVVAVQPSPVDVTPPPPPPGPDYQAALGNLKLVGISWGNDPTAMIEEVETKQTHFLKTGAPIGLFTVKEILEHRVVLQAGEQDFDLF